MSEPLRIGLRLLGLLVFLVGLAMIVVLVYPRPGQCRRLDGKQLRAHHERADRAVHHLRRARVHLHRPVADPRRRSPGSGASAAGQGPDDDRPQRPRVARSLTMSAEIRLTSTMTSAGRLARRAAAMSSSGRRRLVQAVGLAPVGAEEREQPAHALVGVDLLQRLHPSRTSPADPRTCARSRRGACHDPTGRAGPRPGRDDARRWRPPCGSRRTSCAGCCACGWRPCAR